ncbi:MAG: GNAT family N-acetyltransferase [Actinomycetota bacterium]
MDTKALPDFTLRVPHLEEAGAVADLINAASLEDVGAPHTWPEHVRSDWTEPEHSLDDDSRVVEAEDGRLAACLDFYGEPPFTHLASYAYVHPDFRGRGLGSLLLDFVEARGNVVAAASAVEGQRVGLVSWMWKPNHSAVELHKARGYSYVRSFYDMLIEMETPPPTPRWADGITVRTFERGKDERATFAVDKEAFKDHWGHSDHSFETWIHAMIEANDRFDPSLFFLACEGDKLVGLTLGRKGTPEDPNMLWVDDMAVLRPWRRRGVALALLHQLFGEAYAREVRRIGLDVDAQSNTGAVGLYEKAGMRVWREGVAYEKVIRSGSE